MGGIEGRMGKIGCCLDSRIICLYAPPGRCTQEGSWKIYKILVLVSFISTSSVCWSSSAKMVTPTNFEEFFLHIISLGKFWEFILIIYTLYTQHTVLQGKDYWPVKESIVWGKHNDLVWQSHACNTFARHCRPELAKARAKPSGQGLGASSEHVFGRAKMPQFCDLDRKKVAEKSDEISCDLPWHFHARKCSEHEFKK